MSAYGPITTSRTSLLPPTLWDSPRKADAASPTFLSIHHVNRSAVEALPGLFEYLHSVFADEVDTGLSYPQENVRDQAAFANYFFAADVLVAITGTGEVAMTEKKDGVREVDLSVEEARAGRSWEVCVAGFYYVKPNYPGRSSHICNAGFVVPPNQRGGGFGSVLAKSYLHYGPALGYKASVFNLVYVNNTASVRLWEKLNFTKAGLIPKAGRLKRKDGQEGEEYVDAWVFYKSFEGEDRGVNAAILSA
ncbi:hypothetical protein SERLA73DRAFT_178623 [Serpula lacrymans var. lacrymans S7.3]|uniref:N-acetyltransferase domain-containing protein n=2 Tax=Serpula lacrymans var. lacrymans TaxID=341189 RepID=F8PSA4_SERL3|nr:uncharacterized protein SERLADRAFT_463133 [Serpula lacrymans var. lacrymans S7.9]EGO00717.1 hypothetical protein SERLA73DRAFT_178623 [Serpula lacrymans var. lacrymans S7.3]EGO26264.1 hypothetical protein SERLADRAFT_463133 [Serpula lacrymans var. lacrymans S7.9]